mmetsp:Transcript_25196/g.95221  ORF Transcript_25196/g.95221 Transcript_25196/m.95221 type:complete len:210 (+) Transcript_25196:975-1604(+)
MAHLARLRDDGSCAGADGALDAGRLPVLPRAVAQMHLPAGAAASGALLDVVHSICPRAQTVRAHDPPLDVEEVLRGLQQLLQRQEDVDDDRLGFRVFRDKAPKPETAPGEVHEHLHPAVRGVVAVLPGCSGAAGAGVAGVVVDPSPVRVRQHFVRAAGIGKSLLLLLRCVGANLVRVQEQRKAAPRALDLSLRRCPLDAQSAVQVSSPC